MAFNRQVFKTRTLTAIVFAAIMLLGLLWNRWSFLALFTVIHFGCWWEYLKLTEKIHQTIFHNYTKLGLMVMGYGLMLWFCEPMYHINGYGLKDNLSLPVSAAGFALLLTGIFQKNAVNVKSFIMALGGLIYISLSWGLIVELYRFSIKMLYANVLPPFPYGGFNPTEIEYQFYIPLLIVASIWINDTMAYVVGSFFGKTPLSKISPKKTWEGTLGGVALTLLVTAICAWQLDFTIVGVLTTATIICVAGTFGDLFESKLKRMAGVKDSGSLMPGHGGFLDRFDSMLFAVPAVWVYINLFVF